MFEKSDRYVTLVASLPALSPPFTARDLPISALRLESRLRMLDERDAACLRAVEKVMDLRRPPPGQDDAQLLAEYDRVLGMLRDRRLRDALRGRLELRTLMLALRRRKRGGGPPPESRWGHGRYVARIRRGWSLPHFGMERRLPWIVELARLHDADATLELERVLLRLEWEALSSAARESEFDFAAVVLYVLRYRLVEHWLARSAPGARQRFLDLLRSAMGGPDSLAAEAL